MSHMCECQSRRSFLQGVILAGAAVVTLPLRGAAQGAVGAATVVSLNIEDDSNAPLRTAGGAVFVDNPADKDHPIIVFRKDEKTVTAYSSRCTHKGGPLGLPDKNGLSKCKWHGALFDSTGKRVKGIAKTDTKKFAATLEGTTVTVVL